MNTNSGNLLKPDEFAQYLGLAIWLCSMSTEHKEKKISIIDQEILAPILLKQFRVIRDQNLPVAFLTWASISDNVQLRLENSEPLLLDDWRSGSKIRVVDCIAPFGHKQSIINDFYEGIQKSDENSNGAN